MSLCAFLTFSIYRQEESRYRF